MTMFHTFEPTTAASESLKVNRVKRLITGVISSFAYVDKDTRQYVIYCPSLEISGYGETREQAQEMFRFSLDDLFHFWVNGSLEVMNEDLKKLGWKNDRLFRKEFSKDFVDAACLSDHLNAENDQVERVNLAVAA